MMWANYNRASQTEKGQHIGRECQHKNTLMYGSAKPRQHKSQLNKWVEGPTNTITHLVKLINWQIHEYITGTSGLQLDPTKNCPCKQCFVCTKSGCVQCEHDLDLEVIEEHKFVRANFLVWGLLMV